MYWHYKKILLSAAIITCAAGASAQNTTSPYSILGIGDIEAKESGRFFSGGNTATARREALCYNFSNPASLTALPYKTLNMDFAFRGKLSSFDSPYSTETAGTTKDFVLKRISLAFKVSEKDAFAFGLRPFSTVNYQYYGSAGISDGNATIYKETEGEGGISQVYASYGRTIAKGLHAGVTASWLFGNSTRNNTYYSNEAELSLTGKFQQFWYGGGVAMGLQYHTPETKKIQHFLGATASIYQKLKGEFTGTYADASGVVATELENKTFAMPIVMSAGYTASLNKIYKFSVEGQYSKWDYQPLNYSNSYVDDSYKLGVGFEYAPRIQKTATEKFYLAAGFNYERNYMVINNNYMHDRSVSVGAGYNASRIIYLHGGIEAGKRGSTGAGQYCENYTQFVLGFTLKDIWIGSKRFGRFN